MPEWNECPDCKTLYKGSFEAHKRICPVRTVGRLTIAPTSKGPVAYYTDTRKVRVPTHLPRECEVLVTQVLLREAERLIGEAQRDYQAVQKKELKEDTAYENWHAFSWSYNELGSIADELGLEATRRQLDLKNPFVPGRELWLPYRPPGR